jgi:hypothetical protein
VKSAWLSPTAHPFAPVSDNAPRRWLCKYFQLTWIVGLHWRIGDGLCCVCLWPFDAADSTCLGWPAVPPSCVFPCWVGLDWVEDSLSRPREKTGLLDLPSTLQGSYWDQRQTHHRYYFPRHHQGVVATWSPQASSHPLPWGNYASCVCST